ncbi:MAG: alpha/beta hydrolase [Pseudomonadota bacterium]|uniref:alpha/beta fold hydrolase n=1 Tax=Sphingomonas sp. ERG5 TaxID=1381597 RepID=UPI00054C61DE|nr:alpha/beta hydrolase [Sphingomonas sp. ERG5]
MISVGTLNMHVEAAGPADGPILILLHGFPESSRAWRKVMRPLADKGLRVVAPDLRGYGKSDAPHGLDSYRLDTLVADVIGLADALGAADFALVGHDWGGIIAWAVAARHPERIRRLVILNAPHGDTVKAELRAHPAQILRSLYVGFFQIPRLPEALLGAFRCRALRRTLTRSSRPLAFDAADLDAYVAGWSRPGRLTAMLNYYRALRLPRAPLGRIHVPALILWGMKDRFLGAHLADAAAAMCDDARIERFAEATHWIQHEEPRQVAARIAEFVQD